ncbi:hypothetical protein [Streptomyces anulatus]|uniref:hypothetical protein n=1 Tax=Streptomyces anulatus TaxID=1892 RepID=UPI0033D975AC
MTSHSTTLRGGKPVSGEVTVSGFKHVLVLALAHAVGTGGKFTLHNAPGILETEVYHDFLPRLGIPTTRDEEGSLTIDASGEIADTLPEAAEAIHGSLYLLPALLARTGRARFSARFGGCRIGAASSGERPWRNVVQVLERFGAHITSDGPEFVLRAPVLRGASIDLRDFTTDPRTLSGPEYSGATKAAVLTAALAEGPSQLRFPYPKAELTALLDLLRADGVEVERSGDTLAISGQPTGPRLREHRLPADLIEVVSWVTIAATTGGSIALRGVTRQEIDHGLAAELELWKTVGVELNDSEGGLVVSGPGPKGFAPLPPIETLPTSIYSDSQPLFTVLATQCPGASQITDAVWTGRYAHLEGMARLGASLTRSRTGVTIRQSVLRVPPEGVEVHASDLRCAAALLSTALLVKGGPVTVHGTHHLDRGYDHLLDKLAGCSPGTVTQVKTRGSGSTTA